MSRHGWKGLPVSPVLEFGQKIPSRFSSLPSKSTACYRNHLLALVGFIVAISVLTDLLSGFVAGSQRQDYGPHSFDVQMMTDWDRNDDVLDAPAITGRQLADPDSSVLESHPRLTNEKASREPPEGLPTPSSKLPSVEKTVPAVPDSVSHTKGQPPSITPARSDSTGSETSKAPSIPHSLDSRVPPDQPTPVEDPKGALGVEIKDGDKDALDDEPGDGESDAKGDPAKVYELSMTATGPVDTEFDEVETAQQTVKDTGISGNSIAICAIMQRENIADIREWLLYHRWIGVDRVYLRENTNETSLSPGFTSAFKDLQDEGFLDLATWGRFGPEGQQLWYNRCAQKDLAGNQKWVLFIDLDEYAIILNGGVAVEEPDLKEFLSRRDAAAGITLQWVMLGSSGFRDRPTPGGPLRYFHQCTDELSFQMKCVAKTDQLAEFPFLGPGIVHSCCYKFDQDQKPEEWPPVLFGDGTPINATHIEEGILEHSSWDRTPAEMNQRCRSYRGHLTDEDWESHKAIPEGETLVLFHYVTRSLQDFRESKLSRDGGRYASTFKLRKDALKVAGLPLPSDEELLDTLEHDMRVDLEAPVCSSVVEASYVSRCCEL